MTKPREVSELLMSVCPTCGGPTAKRGEECSECREFFAELLQDPMNQTRQRGPHTLQCEICGEQFGHAWQAMAMAKHKWEAHGIAGEASFNGRTKRFGRAASWWQRQSRVNRVLYASCGVGAVIGGFIAPNPIQGLLIGALLGPCLVGGAVFLPVWIYLMVSGLYGLLKKGLVVLFKSLRWFDRFLDP